ncbi:uncharacterized protein LY89DRAFT_732779 [Mollisia scopiformis]|uniref:Uncharacterized protein n=1 Tax=Mollisia scopiformis TaxID=149040 RepID=A0A194XD58_MOLSC|nr:uncharacterized protein LY89DRAFT_732779 [Mollisia scopiformis]KUJ18086.1 hypothetical protein LY89DRAFT_732779 [Mollisia scopiformis]
MAPLRLLTAIVSICLTAVIAQWGAMPGPGLSPRYFLGEAAHLVNRQNGDCPEPNEHTCLDVNAGSFCCPNTHYCIVANNTASCCYIGSTCSNPCDANHYECPSTTSISGTAVSTTSCCSRSCTSTSQYLCASALGGQCCSYNSGCATDTQCVATATSSNTVATTGSSSTCPTSQSPCANSLGGGCCDNGQTCTVADNTNYCASGTALVATRTGPNGILATAPSTLSSGLSTGAKAGIGAGVAVGALVVLGGFIWLYLGHRRRAKQAAIASAPAMSQGSESGTKRPSNGRSGSDYFGPTAAHGPFTEPHDSAATSPGAHRGVPVSPQSPGDIIVPVEIDSKSSRGHSNVTTPGAFEYVKPPSTTVDPVELP